MWNPKTKSSPLLPLRGRGGSILPNSRITRRVWRRPGPQNRAFSSSSTCFSLSTRTFFFLKHETGEMLGNFSRRLQIIRRTLELFLPHRCCYWTTCKLASWWTDCTRVCVPVLLLRRNTIAAHKKTLAPKRLSHFLPENTITRKKYAFWPWRYFCHRVKRNLLPYFSQERVTSKSSRSRRREQSSREAMAEIKRTRASPKEETLILLPPPNPKR